MSEDTFHLGIKALIRDSDGKILLLQVNPAKLNGERKMIPRGTTVDKVASVIPAGATDVQTAESPCRLIQAGRLEPDGPEDEDPYDVARAHGQEPRHHEGEAEAHERSCLAANSPKAHRDSRHADLSAVPGEYKDGDGGDRDQRRDDASGAPNVDDGYRNGGLEERRQHGQTSEVRNPPHALDQSSLADGNLAEEDGEREQRDSGHAVTRAEGQLRHGAGDESKAKGAERAERDGHELEHRRGARDALLVPRPDRLGDLTYAAVLNAHARKALGDIGDGAVDPQQAEAGRSEDQRHRLRPDDSEHDIGDRGPANEDSGPENLPVGACAGGRADTPRCSSYLRVDHLCHSTAPKARNVQARRTVTAVCYWTLSARTSCP